MGYLHDGIWQDGWYDTSKSAGEFVRPPTQFRQRITANGSSGLQAEPGRYHLYVSLACPWAHRTLIFRALKGLEDAIAVSVVEPVMGREGWTFSTALPDRLHGATHLHQVYTRADPHYTGRVTVPVLWDTRTQTIVNNESAEILRMLNREFDRFATRAGDYYPPPLAAAIDAINAVIYDNVNNGVYRCGFAGSQHAHDTAVARLFATLDDLEARLGSTRYLVGGTLTEADWRLFTTLVRFDAVYHGHFKCNVRRIEDYPHLAGYLRELYQVPGVAATVDLDHIKRHYYMSHEHINPTRIVPLGPALDFSRPHGRDALPATANAARS